MPLLPHQFWQVLDPPGTHASAPDGWIDFYPASLPGGQQLPLPIRILPGDGNSAVASLIINQASFAVEDALAAAMTKLLAEYDPELVVGVPTLGLPLAGNVGHAPGSSTDGCTGDVPQVLVSGRAFRADVVDHQSDASKDDLSRSAVASVAGGEACRRRG